MSEPNPHWVTVRAKKKLELVVEFHGSGVRCGVIVDGKQSFGSESIGPHHESILAMAMDHFATLFNQSISHEKPKNFHPEQYREG
jgi:hypothetical protein